MSKRSLWRVALVIIGLHLPLSAAALEFSLTKWHGQPALLATGSIKPGDHQALSRFGAGLKAPPHGNRILLLNSPGGSVEEALRLSEVIGRLNMHTVVPKGAVCASACGAVLFIAGTFRTIEEGGLIGMHSCYAGDTMLPIPECNNEIALHAVGHGVSYGSVYAFMEYIAPEKMVFLSRSEAECWGLTRYFGTKEAGFSRIEPCAIKYIAGYLPGPQSAWRVDLRDGGYFAFVRTMADYELTGQIELYCRENDKGRIYIEVIIPGPAQKIQSAITGVKIFGITRRYITEKFLISQRNRIYSSIRIILDARYTIPLLTGATDFEIRFDVTPQYDPMYVKTYLANSRKNLIFAANHCLS